MNSNVLGHPIHVINKQKIWGLQVNVRRMDRRKGSKKHKNVKKIKLTPDTGFIVNKLISLIKEIVMLSTLQLCDKHTLYTSKKTFYFYT